MTVEALLPLLQRTLGPFFQQRQGLLDDNLDARSTWNPVIGVDAPGRNRGQDQLANNGDDGCGSWGHATLLNQDGVTNFEFEQATSIQNPSENVLRNFYGEGSGEAPAEPLCNVF